MQLHCVNMYINIDVSDRCVISCFIVFILFINFRYRIFVYTTAFNFVRNTYIVYCFFSVN